jgi:transposase-like protein
MEIPEDFPKTALEFEERFATEEACRTYLEKVRWPEGFICPACSGREGWRLEKREMMECASCHRQTSLTAGTVFHGTRKPLRLWFRAMFLMTAQKLGLSAKNFQRLMGLTSYQTAWTWLHKLRRAMVRKGRPKLVGRVEVDESFVGGVVEGVHGRGNPNPLVVAAVERLDLPGQSEKQATPSKRERDRRAGKSSKALRRKARLGRVRMEVVEDASQPSLFTFVVHNVEIGTEVLTDGLASYNELRDGGFNHRPIVIGDNPKQASTHLPGIHRVFSLLKRWLLGTHQGAVSDKHLPTYLQEFTFRFNRRLSSTPAKLFHRLLEQAAITVATTYRELVRPAQMAPLPPPALAGAA